MTAKPLTKPGLLVVLAAALPAATARGEEFWVDPNKGNSNFAAVFDAPLGERINAVSSQVSCNATYDDKTLTLSGKCSVPLPSVKVDSDDTKTDHFQQWVTNKKSPAKECWFGATFDGVKLSEPLTANKSGSFAADVSFTVCGRARADGGKERVTGKVTLFPPGAFGDSKVLKVRGRVEKFNRDAYKIGPKHTEGWLSRVQQLAPVVAEDGAIEISLIAKAKASPAMSK